MLPTTTSTEHSHTHHMRKQTNRKEVAFTAKERIITIEHLFNLKGKPNPQIST